MACIIRFQFHLRVIQSLFYLLWRYRNQYITIFLHVSIPRQYTLVSWVIHMTCYTYKSFITDHLLKLFDSILCSAYCLSATDIRSCTLIRTQRNTGNIYSYEKRNKKLQIKRCQAMYPLTHWGRVTHICVGNLTIIGSDNGLSPGRCHAITCNNVAILLIGPLGTNFSEMSIEIFTFSFKKIHLKMSSGKLRPFCLGLNVLIHCSCR